MPRRLAFIPLLLAGCQSEDSLGLGTGGGSNPSGTGTSPNCPAGMFELADDAGLSASLGETRASAFDSYPGTVIPQYDVQLDGTCMGLIPLPGTLGGAWMRDGLNIGQVEALDALLPDYGRRLCTVSELLAAAAGPDNLRFPFGDEYRQAVCDGEAFSPSPQGAYPECVSATGGRDFLVRSSWAVLDEAAHDAMAPTRDGAGFPGDGLYAVYGGTAQRDTFFSPDNFGIHFYGPDDYSEDNPAYVTDDLRVCAGLGPLDSETEAAWTAWVAALADAGRYAPILGSGL